jgi:NDP-sugar pyrophosphorylase family protein
MIAYLLCAGFGTRMRPLTEETPKSLLSLSGRPILDYLMDELREWVQLEAIHLAANHRHATVFREWASEWRPVFDSKDVTLQVHDDGVSTTDEQLGAVGDLKFLLDRTGLPKDGALVSGGDSLYRFPLFPILNAFDGTASRVLALHEPDPAQRRQSSTLQLQGSRVEGVVENPDAASSTRICPSWYLFSADAMRTVGPYLNEGGDPDTLGAFLHTLAQQQRVSAVRLPQRANLRLHCNTPEDLERTQRLLDRAPRRLLAPDQVQEAIG